MLTPEDVHNVRFQPTRLFEKGYQEHEVDRFLDHVADTLTQLKPGETAAAQTPAGDTVDLLSPWEVHNIAFGKPPIGQRGYNQDQVDDFLDRVEATIRELHRRLATFEQQER